MAIIDDVMAAPAVSFSALAGYSSSSGYGEFLWNSHFMGNIIVK